MPLANPQQDLDSLRSALQAIEAELDSGKVRELGLGDKLNLAERQISAQRQLIREQKRVAFELQDSIGYLEATIEAGEARLLELGVDLESTELYRRSLSEAMARGLLTGNRLKTWAAIEFLLGATGWRDLMARRSLIERLSTSQRQAVEAMNSSVRHLQSSRIEVTIEMSALDLNRQRLVANRALAESTEREIADEAQALGAAQRQLRLELKRHRDSRQLLEARRSEIADAQRAIEDIINKVLRGEPIAGIPLNVLKGKLPWPVSGKVVEQFGLHKNPETETVTENPGIEIAASPDAPVSSVAEGVISSVSWLRGFGNVCIVQHPGAFYSVYARLGEVQVKSGQAVNSGSAIGYPGFDPASEEYRVHFEIWSGRDKRDPVEWLSRK